MQYANLPKNNFHNRKSSGILRKYKPILAVASVIFFAALVISFFKGPASVFNFAFPGSGLKSSEDKINVLLLGNAGGRHDGAYLTDTIMVASYNPKNKSAYFIALPRDLWLDTFKLKLNAVYETGEEKGQGLKLTKEVVGQILGIPIHYGVRLDFGGFEKAVDEVGGVDVVVDKTFDDYLYPLTGKEDDLCGWVEEEKEFNEEEAKKYNVEPGKKKVLVKDGQIATDSADPDKGYDYFKCRFEQIHFKAGSTRMDGKLALKYVRSRMGNNGEGNDFARSKRQQKVIEAFREKVLSLETAVNPKRVTGLLSTLGMSFETDIPIDDMVELYSLSKKIEISSNFVINTTTAEALLINPPPSDYGGAWVLVPRGGNFDKVHEFISKVLNGEINEATSAARTGDSNQP